MKLPTKITSDTRKKKYGTYTYIDKLRLARVIAMLLGRDDIEVDSKDSPEYIIDLALIGLKQNAILPGFLPVIRKALQIADDLEIKYTKGLVPGVVTTMKEETEVVSADRKLETYTDKYGRVRNRKVPTHRIVFNKKEKSQKTNEATSDAEEETVFAAKLLKRKMNKDKVKDNPTPPLPDDYEALSKGIRDTDLGKDQSKPIEPEDYTNFGRGIRAKDDCFIGKKHQSLRHRTIKDKDVVESIEQDDEHSHAMLDDFSDDENLNNLAMGLPDDFFLNAYGEDELHMIDAESGSPISSLRDHEMSRFDQDINEEFDLLNEVLLNEVLLNEVLTYVQRIHAKMRFAQSKAKRMRSIALALHRHSSPQVLAARARHLATHILKLKLAGGRPLESLSFYEKERIEKILESRRNIVSRLAIRLLPRIRQIEVDRLSHHNFTRDQSGKLAKPSARPIDYNNTPVSNQSIMV